MSRWPSVAALLGCLALALVADYLDKLPTPSNRPGVLRCEAMVLAPVAGGVEARCAEGSR